jgi:hypothetical protein
MANKTALRLFYEEEVKQKVCDTTWSRVKRRLRLNENTLDSESKVKAAERIKAYAYLHRVYPNRRITVDSVEQFLVIKQFLLTNSAELECTGKDIYELATRLDPRPSDSTIYRWGEEIGIKFSKTQTYKGLEVNQWIEKIASNPKYKYFTQKLRKIQDGQNQRVA